MKRTALPALAFDPNPSSHHINKLGGNGQSQTRATVSSRGRAVGLLERLENARCLSIGIPMPVSRTEKMEPDAVFRPLIKRDVDHDFATFGELDCITDQVDDNLS